MAPGLGRIVVAAFGALALAVGVVALLDRRIAGAILAAGGAALLLWSVYGRRVGP